MKRYVSFVLLLVSPTLSAEEWGTLTGRLIVEGKVAEPAPHAEPGNDPVCHAAAPVDESVLVGESGGLRNVIVSVRPPRGANLPVHPSYAAPLAKPVVIRNQGCAFTPRVSVLRTGQPLRIKNADPTAHNTKIDFIKNTAVNQIIPQGGEFTTKAATAERLPARVSCSVHPFMRGYLLVRDDPYAAVTDAQGRFRIEHLPAGEHQFQLWHEKGYLKGVAIGDRETDRRGRIQLTIPPSGELNLGPMRVPATLLEVR